MADSPSGSETVKCEMCGETFDPTIAGGYCTNPDCGKWQVPAYRDDSEPSESGPVETEPDTGGSTPTQDNREQSEENTKKCPDCGKEVPADVNFCTKCRHDFTAEEDIDESDAEPLTECPNCEAAIDPGDSFCASCGEDLEAHRDGETDAVDETTPVPSPEPQGVPDYLTLEVDGVEVTDEDGDREMYRDGDTAGRKIRTAAVNAGASREDVQYVHRSHVKFVRESDGFYVLNHDNKSPKNEVQVNGEKLPKGERRELSDGDSIELSGATTATVKFP